MAIREFIIAHPMEPIRNVLKQQILSEYSDVSISDVASGEKILQVLERKKIDCIFAYDGLPDMSLAELAGEIRKNDKIENVPVIPIISKDAIAQKNLLYKGGFSHILEFPQPIPVLKKLIDKIADLRSRRTHKRYNIQDAIVIFHEMNEEVEAELINISRGGMLCHLTYKNQPLFMFQKNLVTILISHPKYIEIRYVVCKLVNLHIVWKEEGGAEVLRMAFRFSYISEENQKCIGNLINMAEKMEIPSIRDGAYI